MITTHWLAIHKTPVCNLTTQSMFSKMAVPYPQAHRKPIPPDWKKQNQSRSMAGFYNKFPIAFLASFGIGFRDLLIDSQKHCGYCPNPSAWFPKTFQTDSNFWLVPKNIPFNFQFLPNELQALCRPI